MSNKAVDSKIKMPLNLYQICEILTWCYVTITMCGNLTYKIRLKRLYSQDIMMECGERRKHGIVSSVYHNLISFIRIRYNVLIQRNKKSFGTLRFNVGQPVY